MGAFWRSFPTGQVGPEGKTFTCTTASHGGWSTCRGSTRWPTNKRRLSPDGRFITFVSERTAGAGERDIFLYDRQISRLVPTPGLNSKEEDFDPCLAYEGAPGDGMP